MPEAWTGRLVGKMHNNRITMKDLSEELGVTRAYVSMLLSSKREPPNVRERLEGAVAEIIRKRKEEG